MTHTHDDESDALRPLIDGVHAKEVDQARIAVAVREILEAIGEDPDRDGLQSTPSRVARMYAEVCAGLHQDPAEHLSTTFEAGHDEMVMVRDIPLYSLCEHHLIPFLGKAQIKRNLVKQNMPHLVRNIVKKKHFIIPWLIHIMEAYTFYLK